MFRVSLTDLIVVYLVLILLLLFAVWIFGDYRRKRREKRERKFHLVCDICGVSYEDRSRDPIPPSRLAETSVSLYNCRLHDCVAHGQGCARPGGTSRFRPATIGCQRPRKRSQISPQPGRALHRGGEIDGRRTQ